MIYSDDEWVQLCKLDDDSEICFTEEYLELMEEIPGDARPFASQLISHWGIEHKTLLDYFGDPDLPDDQYSGLDGEPMDVHADKMDLLEYYAPVCDGLDAEWYGDMYRAKLLSIKLPKRLIKEYIKYRMKEISPI